jgi:hypothetical protein
LNFPKGLFITDSKSNIQNGFNITPLLPLSQNSLPLLIFYGTNVGQICKMGQKSIRIKD